MTSKQTKRIAFLLAASLLMNTVMPVYATEATESSIVETVPVEPAPEVPAAPAPEAPVEPAPEVPVEPTTEAPTE